MIKLIIQNFDMRNKIIWNLKHIANHYSKARHSQAAESYILNKFKDRLTKMKVLDIGVGGGRTTELFAPLAKTYLGIDYSKRMIEVCRKNFGQYKFQTMDAKNILSLEQSFDFILFSHNGIDYNSERDRSKILGNISKATSPKGFFVFSTHNINSLPELFNKNLFKKFLFRLINIFSLMNIGSKKIVKINDGSFKFLLKTCYIDPEHQLDVLRKIGFSNISVLSGVTGEIISLERLAENTNPWLYYICQKQS